MVDNIESNGSHANLTDSVKVSDADNCCHSLWQWIKLDGRYCRILISSLWGHPVLLLSSLDLWVRAHAEIWEFELFPQAREVVIPGPHPSDSTPSCGLSSHCIQEGARSVVKTDVTLTRWHHFPQSNVLLVLGEQSETAHHTVFQVYHKPAAF